MIPVSITRPPQGVTMIVFLGPYWQWAWHVVPPATQEVRK